MFDIGGCWPWQAQLYRKTVSTNTHIEGILTTNVGNHQMYTTVNPEHMQYKASKYKLIVHTVLAFAENPRQS